MVTYDQYEQPDYFVDDAGAPKKRTGLKRLMPRIKRRKKSASL